MEDILPPFDATPDLFLDDYTNLGDWEGSLDDLLECVGSDETDSCATSDSEPCDSPLLIEPLCYQQPSNSSTPEPLELPSSRPQKSIMDLIPDPTQMNRAPPLPTAQTPPPVTSAASQPLHQQQPQGMGAFMQQLNPFMIPMVGLQSFMGPSQTPILPTTQIPDTQCEGTRKRKTPQDKEERRKRNREAADRSRLKKKKLLETLPKQNEELSIKVQRLENEVASLKSENASLKEQNYFLRSLVKGPAGAIESFTGCTSQTNVLMAVVCIFAFNLFAFCDISSMLDFFGDASPTRQFGGRLLLTVNEEDSWTASKYLIPLFFVALFVVSIFSGHTVRGILKDTRKHTELPIHSAPRPLTPPGSR